MARLPAAYLFLFLLLVQVVAEASLSEGKGPLPVQAKGGDEALYKNLYHKIKSSPKINCGIACERRCSKASRKKICLRTCRGCCAKCHCVPPGTYGNKGACPCYANLRTRGNKLKCP